MTADELFLKHVAIHLGQYRGNLRFFCEAIDNGYVPSAEDVSVRPHVHLLKQYMEVTMESDEDELLLRFGLIVPGLGRGVRPPISVLNAERGGFSLKRLEEAEGQVTRLREALRLGRRYFSRLSVNPATALRELAERLERLTDSDDAWVEMHASLPQAEARTLADQALTILNDFSQPTDLAVSILRCLANFRPNGLGSQIAEVLKRNLFWPPSMYRDASDDVAAGLIQRINEASDLELLQLNHLLLTVAWTRGEPALRAFMAWKSTKPLWASGLYVPPEDYLCHAGWTLDANGRRRELVSLSCHRIAQSVEISDGCLNIHCRKETGHHCPACGSMLVWLFDFSNLPREFFSKERSTAPRRILCCPHCACFCPAVFSRYQADGTAELHPAFHSQETSNFGGPPSSIRMLIPTAWAPFAAAEPFGIDDATSLGGVPMWLQDAQYPRCPDCDNVMVFLAQFDNGSMPKAEEGIYYAFFCGDCRVAAVNYQQT